MRLPARVRFDIENDVWAVVDGKEIRLKDIWPSDDEIDAIVKAAVKPEMFRAVYEPMFAIQADKGVKVSPAVRLAPQSTYIRRPPYWGHGRCGRTGRQPAYAEGHAAAGHPAGQHHHRSPVAVQRDPDELGRPVSTCTRWVLPEKTSIPTPPTAATT